jgi:putative endopeptidase
MKPTDDFFTYVNGDWIKNNPIPPEESQWGSFYILRVQVEKQLKNILDGLLANPVSGDEVARKVRDFYSTGMDVKKLEQMGITPLKETFAVVDAMKDKSELPTMIGRLHRIGASSFWGLFVEQDERKSEMVAAHLYQGGLSLPDRDYYLNEDEKTREIRAKFSKYIVSLLKLSSTDPTIAAHAAEVIMNIETRLAKASRTRVALRDVEKQYNKKSPAELGALTPAIAWKDYFTAIGAPLPEYFIVGQPEFFTEVDKLIASISLEEIKIYLSWHFLNAMAGYLGENFGIAAFDFYGRTFGGATEQKVRWRRVLGTVNGLLDEALGKLYVEKHFSEDAKRKVYALVDDLIAAYRVRIEKLDWMEAETKKKALEKLAGFSRKLGYPDQWKDISGLVIKDDSYAANCMRAYAFEFDRQIKKIGKPVDRTEWLMPPQMVNAYYQPPMNEIVFPAAILQPPFFDPRADDALNYGGIGTVIGHELTHGFDDQGSLFNAKGNLENWWTPADKERFDAKTVKLAAQFDAYEPLPGLHMNGKLTLGENIADLGGIIIAYDALNLSLAKKGDPGKIEGLTPAQRFFTNYAVTERGVWREEIMRVRIQTDPHSIPIYRVNGPMSNITAFYEVFDTQKGDGLWREPEDRVKIW